MNRSIIEDDATYTIYHDVGYTKFGGCQCFGDCSCAEDFKSEYFDRFAVFKKTGKPRTTHHDTMEEVRERIKQFNPSHSNKG